MFDAYIAAKRDDPKCRFPQTIEDNVARLRDHFGALLPEAINPLLVSSFTKRRRREGVKDGTIDKNLRTLRAAINWAKKQQWDVTVHHIETPGGGQARKRFLSRAEWALLWDKAQMAECAPHVRLTTLLGVQTAQRMRAILSLRWELIDFEHGLIWFPPGLTKYKSTVTVPMTATVRRELTEAREFARTDWVIEYQDGPVSTVRQGFARLCSRAKLDDVTFHDLRRTAASWALMAGATFSEVAALLGDNVAVVEKHYAHFSPGFLRSVVDKIEGG